MKTISLLVILCASVIAYATPTLKSLEGTDVVSEKKISFDLTSSAKGNVLVFLSAKCPCSASHEILLNDLTKKFPDFKFIGIHSNSDEDSSLTKSHFKEAQLNFPVLQDIKNLWANQLGALKTPHAFVFNPHGDLLYQGGVTDSHVGPSAKQQFLKNVLEDIQQGKAPRISEGRALGCFIQRED